MSNVNYKSTRLLVEAVNREMESVRKAAMGNLALGSLNELRDLVSELAKKADRLALEDVRELAPADYVAAMKPLVAEYHRLLAAHDLLVPCLREDLGLNAVVLIMMDDTRSVVRTIHRPDRPEFEIAVGAVVAAIEVGAKKAMEEGIADLETRLGASPTVPELSPDGEPELAGDDLEHQQLEIEDGERTP
jgi:hypothetical protein